MGSFEQAARIRGKMVWAGRFELTLRNLRNAHFIEFALTLQNQSDLRLDKDGQILTENDASYLGKFEKNRSLGSVSTAGKNPQSVFQIVLHI